MSSIQRRRGGMTTKHDLQPRHTAKFQLAANYSALRASPLRGRPSAVIEDCTPRRRSRLRYVLHTAIAVALATAAYQPAWAQQATPAAQSEPALAEVVVTGSR